MHLIIDIRSPSPIDPIVSRYARSWVDLWREYHPRDLVSYIHFDHQDCPDNGISIPIKSTWYWWYRPISVPWSSEIFRCVSFSSYDQYDPRIVTITHIFDHASSLYPWLEWSWIAWLIRKNTKNHLKKSSKIIVPSLSTGQETVDIAHIREDDIEIIPYISLSPEPGDHLTLSQLSISWHYWLYDGSYGSEANIAGLLRWYKQYRELGGIHTLICIWQLVDNELSHISELIQKMNLTGSVRIIGSLEWSSIESIYMHASGWIYVGAYYTGGPRIELARSYQLPLLISNIPSLVEYHSNSITLHPNHLEQLWQSLRDLEYKTFKKTQKISNEDIMKIYTKILAEKR